MTPDPKTACHDCGLPYAKFGGDVSLPHDVWERINPTEHRGCGLLCANCIMRRLSAADHPSVPATLWPSCG